MRTRLDHLRAALFGECPARRFVDKRECSRGRHHRGDHWYTRTDGLVR